MTARTLVTPSAGQILLGVIHLAKSSVQKIYHFCFRGKKRKAILISIINYIPKMQQPECATVIDIYQIRNRLMVENSMN
jgi:hypothetical protein